MLVQVIWLRGEENDKKSYQILGKRKNTLRLSQLRTPRCSLTDAAMLVYKQKEALFCCIVLFTNMATVTSDTTMNKNCA